MIAYEIPLSAVPSQQLNMQLGTSLLSLRLKTLQGVDGIFLDINIDDEDILCGIWCKQDVNLLTPVLSVYSDLELKMLFFKSNSDVNTINYSDFGTKTRLYYAI